jgi:O-antigen/teichoic acid export membrane protein
VSISRYAMSAAGPIGVSAVTFIGTLLLIRTLPPAEFGLMAFLMVVVNLGSSLSNALVATPYSVIANAEGATSPRLLTLHTASVLFSLALGVVTGLIAVLFGVGEASAWFALFGFMGTMRWFARGTFLSHHSRKGALRSDLAYSAVLAFGLWVSFGVGMSIRTASMAFALAAVAGYLSAGPAYLRHDLRAILQPTLSGYLAIWREKSGWGLLGVLTTELTANAHAWIVTLFAGPAAFAPLAASAVLMRPVGVIAGALTQAERPRMTRSLAAGNTAEARAALGPFRKMMLAIWAMTSVAAFAVMILAPGLIFPQSYGRDELLIGLGAWTLVWLLRSLRTADSALLQAASRFRPLAMASVWSSLVAVLGVLVTLVILGPLFTLAALLIAELVYATLLKRLKISWERKNA